MVRLKPDWWDMKRSLGQLKSGGGSTNTSCHGREIERLWEELRDFASRGNETVNWFMSMGYVSSGLLPDIYGRGHHGIVLIKRL